MKSVITVLAFFVFVSISFAQPHIEQGGTNPPTPQEPPNGWYKQTSGTTQWLPKIFFLNKDTGWVGGPEGLYWTTNGGNEWILLTTKLVEDPTFVDGKNGWAITGNKTVGKTTDGGKTWNDTLTKLQGGISELQIFGYDTVYIHGDIEFTRTTDRGKTWNLISSHVASTNDMHFVNNKLGFICGDVYQWFNDFPPAPGTMGASFGYTSDGGLSWHPRFPFIEGSITKGIEERLREIFAVSTEHIFCAGGTSIYESKDAGKNWKSILSDVSIGGLFFITPKYGYAVGFAGIIYCTTDTGKTWTQQNSTVSDHLYDVIFVDTLRGWACGDAGTIIHTTDGGKLWTRQYLPFDSIIVQTYPEPAQNITSVHYTIPSPQHVTLRVFDPSGREVATPLVNVFQLQGEHTIPINLSMLPPGAYYVRFESNKYRSTVRVTIVR